MELAVAPHLLVISPTSRYLLGRVLRLDGTAMHPSALLVAKLFWGMSWLEGLPSKLSMPFVPLWSSLNVLLPWSVFLSQTLLILWVVAGLLLMFNCWPRACSALLGHTLLFNLIASPTNYHNHVFMVACAWLLAAASSSEQRAFWFRWQFVIIYLFAALNKIWEPDWRSGQFFEAWFELGPSWYRYWTDQLPSGWLGQGMAWSTIGIELLIGALFLRKQTVRSGVLLVATFHWLMFLAATGLTFGYFLHHILILLLVFVERPAGKWTLSVPAHRLPRWKRALAWLDPIGRFSICPSESALHLQMSPETHYSGRHALTALCFRLPVVLVALLIAAIVVPPLLPTKLGILLLFSAAATVIILSLGASASDRAQSP